MFFLEGTVANSANTTLAKAQNFYNRSYFEVIELFEFHCFSNNFDFFYFSQIFFRFLLFKKLCYTFYHQFHLNITFQSKMTTLRPFDVMDLFKFNNVNLDMNTETVSYIFIQFLIFLVLVRFPILSALHGQLARVLPGRRAPKWGNHGIQWVFQRSSFKD